MSDSQPHLSRQILPDDDSIADFIILSVNKKLVAWAVVAHVRDAVDAQKVKSHASLMLYPHNHKLAKSLHAHQSRHNTEILKVIDGSEEHVCTYHLEIDEEKEMAYLKLTDEPKSERFIFSEDEIKGIKKSIWKQTVANEIPTSTS